MYIWGLAMPDRLAALLMIIWAAYSFSSAYFQTWFWLANMNVRKPVKEEEDKLKSLFDEILIRAGVRKKVNVMIEEQSHYNAFAIGVRTICVSKALLDDFDTEELKAVLAHEFGHLQSKDTVLAAAFVSAGIPIQTILTLAGRASSSMLKVLRLALTLLSAVYRPTSFVMILGVLALLFLMYKTNLIAPIAVTLFFAWGYPKVHKTFRYFFNMNARFIEYKQDKYAYRLGYGTALREVLIKLSLNGPQSVSIYETLMNGNHPVIHNRIRRLERLEGIR